MNWIHRIRTTMVSRMRIWSYGCAQRRCPVSASSIDDWIRRITIIQRVSRPVNTPCTLSTVSAYWNIHLNWIEMNVSFQSILWSRLMVPNAWFYPQHQCWEARIRSWALPTLLSVPFVLPLDWHCFSFICVAAAGNWTCHMGLKYPKTSLHSHASPSSHNNTFLTYIFSFISSSQHWVALKLTTIIYALSYTCPPCTHPVPMAFKFTQYFAWCAISIYIVLYIIIVCGLIGVSSVRDIHVFVWI